MAGRTEICHRSTADAAAAAAAVAAAAAATATAALVLPLSFPALLLTAAQMSFNFTSFNPNMRDINYAGYASASDKDIQLTSNRAASIGRATYIQAFQLWDNTSGKFADFTTNFSFIIDSQKNLPYADGIAFFLAPHGFALPDTPAPGGGLGLVSGGQILDSKSNPFVAVEFDTFQNDWDQPHDHIGININSMVSVSNVSWWNDIFNGKSNDASISYTSSSKNLCVVFTGFESNTIQQSLCYSVNLSEYLPEWVTFGFSAATGFNFEIHTICSWSFSSNLQTDKITSPGPGALDMSHSRDHSRANKRRLEVGLVGTACVLVGGLGFLLFGSWKKRKRVEKKNDFDFNISYGFENETGPKKFSYRELAVATKNFAKEQKLGEGGFGAVYRGFLRDLNSYVAVKRVSRGSKQGIKEFASEVKVITRLRHRNLVQLMGWCHEGRELLLVYEFMSNGSLDSHLFKENSLLTWVMRYNIAQGLASALFYLHEEWEQCVLHRDIKSSNIILDANFNAKLGDFGLARLVDHGKVSQTTVLAGTMGYIAPECVMTCKASKESDVYSFGVVALELACGRKPINPMADEDQIIMVDWVWGLYGMGELLKAADPRLCSDFDEEQMQCLIIVGLWCAHPDCNLRPSMKQAIQVLNFEAPLPNLPPNMPQPTYLAPPAKMTTFSSSSSSYGATGSEGGQNQSY
ncbi:hypothetical protein F0562_028845 [Nyssa sinensis]|uniref:non-specific serine/threonine protein kinase n=1 Tax=Nyssa sinensis TaxID=561372 RepID=A0A5J5B3I0_9ASTE|nr:hypothetical protein F0562_028845 [Nyssa sinensis]